MNSNLHGKNSLKFYSGEKGQQVSVNSEVGSRLCDGQSVPAACSINFVHFHNVSSGKFRVIAVLRNELIALRIETRVSIIIAIIFVLCVRLQQAQYDDVRCKCICPPPLNRTVSDTKKVYVKPLPPIDCDCKHVVSGLPTDQCAQNDFCLRCKCSYESRNTTSVKIGVVFVICVVSLLLAYTGVWYCLEIFVHKNSDRRRTRALRTVSVTRRLPVFNQLGNRVVISPFSVLTYRKKRVNQHLLNCENHGVFLRFFPPESSVNHAL